MEQIERATGKQIIRIETTDLDTMEEVRHSDFARASPRDPASPSMMTILADAHRSGHTANEEGTEVEAWKNERSTRDA